MKLKPIALMIVITGILINAAHGMVVRVSIQVDISNSNGCPVYAINDRPVTRPALTNLLGRLASLDKDQTIYLIVDKQVSALSLVSTISDIQNTGLHDFVLVCPAVEDGKQGAYQISIDATKQLVSGGCCGGSGVESGFHESVDVSLENVPDQTLASKPAVRKMLTADHLFVVNGALPVKQDGSVFFYREKCLKCGYASDKEVAKTFPAGKSTITSEFKCPKCGEQQVIRIDVDERNGQSAIP